jgi:ribosomal protein L37E
MTIHCPRCGANDWKLSEASECYLCTACRYAMPLREMRMRTADPRFIYTANVRQRPL